MSEEKNKNMVVVDKKQMFDIQNIEQEMSFSKAKYEAMTKYIDSFMKKGTHYGPPYKNAGKNVLLKSGAELLCQLHRCHSVYTVIDKTVSIEKNFVSYSVNCEIVHNNEVVGAGVGECNTEEKKYKYENIYKSRKIVGTRETIDRVGKANTILKMAKKRALVDACLSTFVVSSEFTQDVEEFDDYRQAPPQEEYYEEPPPPKKEKINAMDLPENERKDKVLNALMQYSNDKVKPYFIANEYIKDDQSIDDIDIKYINQMVGDDNMKETYKDFKKYCE